MSVFDLLVVLILMLLLTIFLAMQLKYHSFMTFGGDACQNYLIV